ncbi:MAG: hypothetical protein OXR68_00625 [Alphaproteobacteria bacterium]|nr:hypothetical protein [Alphaproteobacteria bacterium]MDD9919115.1 hypothetical protein [Alphaproteobacteria bacterium]
MLKIKMLLFCVGFVLCSLGSLQGANAQQRAHSSGARSSSGEIENILADIQTLQAEVTALRNKYFGGGSPLLQMISYMTTLKNCARNGSLAIGSGCTDGMGLLRDSRVVVGNGTVSCPSGYTRTSYGSIDDGFEVWSGSRDYSYCTR